MVQRIKRRTVVAGAAAATVASPAIAQTQSRTLRLVTSWPRSSPVITNSATRIAETITQLTEGRITFEIFHSGERVGPFEVLDAVRRGRADCYHSVEQYWIDKHPAFAFFSAVPFGLVANEMSGWLQFSGGQALWEELSAKFGVIAFMAGSPGAQMGGWFPRPINSKEDLAGMRFRIQGAAAEIYKKAGMDPVSLPADQLIDALFGNKLDAVEWLGPYLDLNYGFVKLLPHYMYPGWHDPGAIRSFGVNLDVFNSLSPTEQEIFRLAASRENSLLEAELNQLNGQAVVSMKREYGAQVHEFPQELLQELFALANESMAKIGAHDDLAQRTHDSYMAYRDTAADYALISSSAYLEARNSALSLAEVSIYDD
ncbi:MAG: TRAP transporter substrate-binding protein [Pseudomonadota bacterium]